MKTRDRDDMNYTSCGVSLDKVLVEIVFITDEHGFGESCFFGAPNIFFQNSNDKPSNFKKKFFQNVIILYFHCHILSLLQVYLVISVAKSAVSLVVERAGVPRVRNWLQRFE